MGCQGRITQDQFDKLLTRAATVPRHFGLAPPDASAGTRAQMFAEMSAGTGYVGNTAYTSTTISPFKSDITIFTPSRTPRISYFIEHLSRPRICTIPDSINSMAQTSSTTPVREYSTSVKSNSTCGNSNSGNFFRESSYQRSIGSIDFSDTFVNSVSSFFLNLASTYTSSVRIVFEKSHTVYSSPFDTSH